MPEQRHRTVLEYRLDDRQLKAAEQTMARVFDDKLLKAFETTLERSAKHLEILTKTAERFDAAMKRSAGPAATPARVAPGGGGSGAAQNAGLAGAMSTLSRSIQQLQQAQRRQPGAGTMFAATAAGSYLGGLGSRLGGGGDGILAQAASGIPIVGGFIGAAVNAVQRYYQEYAQQQIAISRSVGPLGSRRIAAGGAFTGFGLARGEAFGQAAQYAQAGGLSGDELTGDISRTALRMQFLGGIQDPTSIIGAAGVGGGMTGRSGAQVMMRAVSAGMLSGIREARLGQFMQAMSQALEQARLEGADLSPDSINQLVAGIAALGPGFTGEQAQRAMSSALPTMRAFQPGMDVASLVGLRAAGFGSPGGPSYHEALRRFQERPHEILPQIISTIRAMGGGNEAAQVELMRQIAPRFLGFTPTIQQAESLMAGDLSGFGEVDERGGEQFLGRREGLRGAFGVPATEAAFANRRAAVGRRTAGAALAVRRTEMDITESILPRVATGIEQVVTYLRGLYETFTGAGMTEMLRQMLGDLLPSLGVPVTPDVQRRIRQLTEGRIPDDAGQTPMMGTPLPPDLQRRIDEAGPQEGWERELQQFLHDWTGAPSPEEVDRRRQQRQREREEGPSASAVEALRRMSRDAQRAADMLEGVDDGDLAMG